MKTQIYKALIAFALALLLSACVTDNEFDGDETKPMMVMNSIICADSIVKVQLSQSNFFLSSKTSFDHINDATVSIFVNNLLHEQLTHKGEGVYIGNYQPKPNDMIMISCENKAFGQVSSQVMVATPAEIMSVDTVSKNVETTAYVSQNGNRVDTFGVDYKRDIYFKVKFRDEGKIKNYYRLVLKEKTYFSDSTVIQSSSYFATDDLVFGGISDNTLFDEGRSQSRFNEFDDQLFDGKEYELSFNKHYHSFVYLNDPVFKISSEDVYPTKEVLKIELIIELHSISSSLYYYLRTKNSGNGGLDIFSEPVQIYSNIDGGLGILGSYSIFTHSINIPLSYQSYSYYD